MVATVGPTTICLSGEHDAFNADVFSAAMARAMATGEADVVVELHEVEFMAVATVGVILRARAILRLQSRSVVLRSPSPCAQRVLSLCGAADLVERSAAAGGGP
ncbi:MAG: STAS domain-containing protein [Actinobacteria bacterium]|nr:STAS domain-containing protein [Actinomycetota bacterium]